MVLRFFFGVALLSSALLAAPIVGLNNTGSGLGDGAADTNWVLLSPPQQGVVITQSLIPLPWIANDPSSRWIWETERGEPTNVTRTFRTTFNIGAGLDPGTATIVGRWAADDAGLDILLNGMSTGQSALGFAAWSGFVLNSGFAYGLNTIDFIVQDAGFMGGFRAEFTSSNIEEIPEPTSVVLTGLGLCLGVFLRHRHST